MKELYALKPKNRYLKYGIQINIAGTFVLGFGIIVFSILAFPATTFAVETSDSYFNQLRKTTTLPANSLTVQISGQEFNYSNVNNAWWSHDAYSISNKPVSGFGKRVSSLPVLVKQYLGVENPWQAYKTGQQVLGFGLNRETVARELHKELTAMVNTPAQSAVLEIENGNVVSFQPHAIGRSVDMPATINKINKLLFTKASTTTPVIVSVVPTRTLEQTNSLGIKELVAHGESDFSGSTRSRIQNIQVGSARFNGVLIKPGEEFSFNHYLGEVTAETGFLPELVIKSTGTVPELGGGLCQVSTTAFRAALYGGLKITERRNHSYAVKYYAPQGTDATIYPGVVDFKFINDTSGHLLIATYMEGNKLFFDFYGTKDDRQVAIDGPHHYAFGQGGAMKASLSRTVTHNGQVLEDEFFSNYVSQDLFPRVYEYPEPTQPQEPAEPVPTETPVNEGANEAASEEDV